MKYKNEVIINVPREKVVELFADPTQISKWQPGFVSIEHVSGEIGQEGSKSKLVYLMGKRQVEMVETITARKLPELFAGTYETKGVWNEVTNHFEALPEGTTRYWTENEFKMSGMMKIFAFLMPGAFKKQSQKYLDLFKDFAEKEAKETE